MPIERNDLLKIKELLEKELTSKSIKLDRKQAIEQELKTITDILKI